MTHETESMASSEANAMVEDLFIDFETTTTKAGWCLKRGLQHVAKDPKIWNLVAQHGIPNFYECFSHAKHCHRRHDATQDLKDPSNSFESLCRTIVGQCVAGATAQAVYQRLVKATNNQLTPLVVLRLFQRNVEKTQKQIGLSRAKLNSLLDLSRHFEDGRLSEEFLGGGGSSTDEIRVALLQVKGIGQWSCDMRKGIQKCFNMTNQDRIREYFENTFGPYQSLATYYMWRVADEPKKTESMKRKQTTPLSPTKARKRSRKVVTP